MTPTAKKVKPLNGYRLLVDFDNGEARIYDATPLIRGDWFGQLKDVNVFNTVHIAGISVEWAGGQDVCPDDLYHNSIPVEKVEVSWKKKILGSKDEIKRL